MNYLLKVKELRENKKELERIKDSIEVTLAEAKKSAEENHLLILTLSNVIFSLEKDIEELDNSIFANLVLNKPYRVKELSHIDFEDCYIN